MYKDRSQTVLQEVYFERHSMHLEWERSAMRTEGNVPRAQGGDLQSTKRQYKDVVLQSV